MPSQSGRYTPARPAGLAGDWTLQQLTPPSRLYGANGIRSGADGRLYVAQVPGSQISAVDIDSGDIETISPMGGDIVAPDDIAFDEHGNIFATEITEGRVSMLKPDGQAQVVYGDMPSANPITMHHGRLFAGECRPDGRIMELDLNGGAPRLILDNVPMPNAMEVGSDGKLYIPIMGSNEIWRVSLDGGEPEVVARDLGVPDSVKFDADGRIVSTQVASGQVLRINPATGEKTVLATIAPGLDNCSFVDKRLFVSSISGQINEILASGEVRSLIPDGLQWPMGLAMGSDGLLLIADGGFTYTLKPGEKPQTAGMLFTPGFPGFTRGVAAAAPGEYVVTTASGTVNRWRPADQESEVLADGLDQLMGVAIAPGGAAIFAELGTGRVLSASSGKVETIAKGLEQPMGVAVADDGDCYVAESAAGRVVKLFGGRAETVIDGLQCPHGIVIQGDSLYIVDVDARQVLEANLTSGARRSIATQLPVGAPEGITPTPLRGIVPFNGPMNPLTGIAAGADGTLYVSADAEGSILALHRT